MNKSINFIKSWAAGRKCAEQKYLSFIKLSGGYRDPNNLTEIVLMLANDERKRGVSDEEIVSYMMSIPIKGSWESQEIARALKMDEGLRSAGLSLKLFRNTGPVGPREKTRKKSITSTNDTSNKFNNGEDLANYLLRSAKTDIALELLEEAYEAICREDDKSKPLAGLHNKTEPSPFKNDHSIFAISRTFSEWLLKIDEPADNLQWRKEVASVGSEPFQEGFFDAFLRQHGYTPYPCGSQNCDILIVGRSNWHVDQLLQHIDARRGKRLRIYSQEIALLAIVTGYDPFEAGENLLLQVGNEHPAIKYLIDSKFSWPCVGEKSDNSIHIDGMLWRGSSPLTAMGYHVGLTSQLSENERRSLLKNIFKGRLVFPDEFSEYEKMEWGLPESSVRLKKMASHIVQNIRLHGNRLGSDSTAVIEWKTDLVWLRQSFYKGKFRFGWPNLCA